MLRARAHTHENRIDRNTISSFLGVSHISMLFVAENVASRCPLNRPLRKTKMKRLRTKERKIELCSMNSKDCESPAKIIRNRERERMEYLEMDNV